MGEAKRKLTAEAEMMTFDAGAIPFSGVKPRDVENLCPDGDGDLINLRLFGMVAKAILQNAYGPQGAKRQDRKIVAAWLDVCDSDQLVHEIPRSMITLLRRYVCSDSVPCPPLLSGWAESVADYLDKLADAPQPAAPEPAE